MQQKMQQTCRLKTDKVNFSAFATTTTWHHGNPGLECVSVLYNV